MPLYEYECLECGERFEVIQKFSDPLITEHRANGNLGCGGPVKKLLAAPAIQFKGTGWYVTDYGKGGKKPKLREEAAAAKDSAKSASGKDKASKAAKPPRKPTSSRASAEA